jgi:hypothetical protein
MTRQCRQKFDAVFCGLEAIETAEHFGGPNVLRGDEWSRSEYEGQPTDIENEMLLRLCRSVNTIWQRKMTNKRTLYVTSGACLQAIDHIAKAGFPQDCNIDNKAVATKPNWSSTGQLFRLTDKGLERVADNEEPAEYFIEQVGLAYNNRPANSAEAHRVSFLRLLWQTEAACWDRITKTLVQTGVAEWGPYQGHEPETHTAVWLAMRRWKEEIAPYYEKLISMPDLGTKRRAHLNQSCCLFLCEVANAFIMGKQYAAAKKLFLESRVLFGEAEDIPARGLRELEKIEQKLGRVFDPEAWEETIPSALRSSGD